MSFLEAVVAKVIKNFYKITDPFSGEPLILVGSRKLYTEDKNKREAAEKRLAKKAEKLSVALEARASDLQRMKNAFVGNLQPRSHKKRKSAKKSKKHNKKSKHSKKSQDVQQTPKPRVSVIKNAALSSSSSSASSSSDDDAQASRNPQQV